MEGLQELPPAAVDGTILRSRISEQLYTYWRGLAERCGGVPRRGDFDPSAVPALLPYLFIAEKESASDRFLFRLSGTAIRDITGLENTNRYLDELLQGADLTNVQEMFEQVITEQACIRSIERLTYSDHRRLRVEILRLPFGKDDGSGNLVIGCLSQVDAEDCDVGALDGCELVRIDNDIIPRESF